MLNSFVLTALIAGFVYVAGGIGFGTYISLLAIVALLRYVVWPFLAIWMVQRYITSMR